MFKNRLESKHSEAGNVTSGKRPNRAEGGLNWGEKRTKTRAERPGTKSGQQQRDKTRRKGDKAKTHLTARC